MGLFSKFQKQKKAAAGAGLRVSDFLTEQTVAFFPAGPSKRQVFGSLIGLFDLADPGAALKAILAREEAGSTVIAPGLALPHARITGIPRLRAALGLCPGGIQYSHAVEEPVKLVLLFLGPAENMREHLAFLAGASALFQNSELVKRLLTLTSPKPVLRGLQEAEQSAR